MQTDQLWVPETGSSMCLPKDSQKHFRRLLTATRLVQLWGGGGLGKVTVGICVR